MNHGMTAEVNARSNRFFRFPNDGLILLSLIMLLAASSGNPFMVRGADIQTAPPPPLLPRVRNLQWNGFGDQLSAAIQICSDHKTLDVLNRALLDLVPHVWTHNDEVPLYGPVVNDRGMPTGYRATSSYDLGLANNSSTLREDRSAVQQAADSEGLDCFIVQRDPTFNRTEEDPALMLLINVSDEMPAPPLSDVEDRWAGTDQFEIPLNDVARLSSDGYFLVSDFIYDGDMRKPFIIAASTTQRGLLYAVITWIQLAREQAAHPKAKVIDSPTFPMRGVIEGFYGPPWSTRDRMNQLAFYPWVKMNTYIYAPKDDPYHQKMWDVLYPDHQFAPLRDLIHLANDYLVDFVFAISPGLSIQYGSDRDFERLVEKTEQMRTAGVKRFALLLDDIPMTLQHPADREQFDNDLAVAQAFLVNRYAEYLRHITPDHPLIVVPTEYWGLEPTHYQNRFAEMVDEEVIIFWTGPYIVPPTITSRDVAYALSRWRHPLILWDNYPVNDYSRDRLHFAPLEGRSTAGFDNFLGFTFNPMNEAEASKIPLATAADYAWLSESYHPSQSAETALQNLIPASARDAFRLLTSNYRTSDVRLNADFSLVLRRLIDARDLSAEDRERFDLMMSTFQQLDTLPQLLEDGNPALAAEVAPWIEKLSLAGRLIKDYDTLDDPIPWLRRYAKWEQIPLDPGDIAQVLTSIKARVTP